MTDGITVDLGDWEEFVRDLHSLPRRIEQEIREPMRNEAQKVVARAATLAPRKTGALAQRTSTRLTITPRYWSFTIRWLAKYSGVQEWARDYQRRTANGTQTVHMTKGEPPRFAYRAWQEMQPTFGPKMVNAIVNAVTRTGYWKAD
jgi:hypothetical protein